jgi:hypothetical protein
VNLKSCTTITSSVIYLYTDVSWTLLPTLGLRLSRRSPWSIWGISVTNNSGFWIRWLDLLALLYNYNQLRQPTINGCPRLAPFLTGPLVSSLPLWRRANHWSHVDWLELLNDVCLTNLYEDSHGIQSESYIMTDGQSASLSWNKAPIWGPRPDIHYSQTVAGLFMWGALSDERTGLSFTTVAGLRQYSHSWVRVQWDSWPYFTVSDSRLPFSSPPETRRATVEVFDPASTRENLSNSRMNYLS